MVDQAIAELLAAEEAWLKAIAARDRRALDELLAAFSCITYRPDQ